MTIKSLWSRLDDRLYQPVRGSQIVPRIPQRLFGAMTQVDILEMSDPTLILLLDDPEPYHAESKDGEGDVRREERRYVKGVYERREAVEEEDDGEGRDARVGHVGLTPAAEEEVAAVDTLQAEGALEAHVAEADGDPRDEAAEGCDRVGWGCVSRSSRGTREQHERARVGTRRRKLLSETQRHGRYGDGTRGRGQTPAGERPGTRRVGRMGWAKGHAEGE